MKPKLGHKVRNGHAYDFLPSKVRCEYTGARRVQVATPSQNPYIFACIRLQAFLSTPFCAIVRGLLPCWQDARRAAFVPKC